MSQISNKIYQLSPLQRAALALKEMRAKLEAMERTQTEAIAIIGMSCRFPQANTPEAFWELLRDGVDAVTEVPKERWDIDAYYDPDPDAPGKMYTRYGAFLENVDQFDPLFFGISPREAGSIDPQHRLLLEVSWEALERAGYAPTLAPTRTGVFIGITEDDYADLPSKTPLTAYDGNWNFCFAPGRLSYIFGLQGPNMAIDTACSSSLVAVHQAVMSLRARESDLALAGGVHLHLDPEKPILLSKMRALAPDGRCKTFSADADGYGRGEGCGVVVLKRLSDAHRDGDNILAVIRGSAINHDGPSSGLTVPNKLAQEAVIQQALSNAKVKPQEVSYIEAHGTGTALGDPLEIRALGAVLGERSSPLIVGSVKTNIGHLEAASGIAALIKVVQAFQHGEIPPHLHFTAPNPNLNWDEWPITIPTEPVDWPTEKPIAGISAFGLSGTNAHLVLEAPPKQQHIQHLDRLGAPPEREHSLHLLTLSAKTPEALTELAGRYVEFLANTRHHLADICFTANSGRSQFTHRVSVMTSQIDELREKLMAFTAGEPTVGLFSGQASHNRKPKARPERSRRVAFLFTGQGSQYVGMGRDIYETQPIFRQTIDRCDEILRTGGYVPSLLSILYPEPANQPTSQLTSQLTNQLHETAYTQPALFAIEYALAQMWKSWGIEPDVVMGHSVGEYVAACVAGVFTLEDGLKLIAERGRLMQALPTSPPELGGTEGGRGEMVAVMASEEQVASILDSSSVGMTHLSSEVGNKRTAVSLAAINGPQSVVISGQREAIRACGVTLKAKGIKTKKLTVSHAFHSPLMEPMIDSFARFARQVTYKVPQINFVSNLTGEFATSQVTTPEYWVRHIREPVRFMAGIESLHQHGVDIFVEIGPKPILLGMGRQCLPEDEQTISRGTREWLPSLRPDSEWPQLLATLSQLYVRGVTVDWSGFYSTNVPSLSRVVLPTYPFQRQSYWLREIVRPERLSQTNEQGGQLGPFFNKMVQSPLLKEILFESHVSKDNFPYLADHLIHGEVVVPGAFHVSLILNAAKHLFGHDACELEDIIFPEALVLAEGEYTLQLLLTPEASRDNHHSASHGLAQGATFQVISFAHTDQNWPISKQKVTVHAMGRVLPASLRHAQQKGTASAIRQISIRELKERCQTEFASTRLYEATQEMHIQLGPSFRRVTAIWKGEGEALCQVEQLDSLNRVAGYQLHPTLVDALFQIDAAIIDYGQETHIPFAIKKCRFNGRPNSQLLWAYIRKVKKLVSDIQLLDQTGEVIAEIIGFEAKKATREIFNSKSVWQEWLFEMTWQQEERLMSQSQKGLTSLGRWLIFADQNGVAQQLATLIEQQGGESILVFPQARSGHHPDFDTKADGHHINPTNKSDYQQLIANVGPLDGIVHLWALDTALYETIDLEQIYKGGTLSTLYLVQALVEKGHSPSLWLVTQGSQAVLRDEEVLGPCPVEGFFNGSLWGMGKVIALEHPELNVTLADLEPKSNVVNAQHLFEEIAVRRACRGVANTLSEQMAFRGDTRYVARLAKYVPSPQRGPFRLEVEERENLESLQLHPAKRGQPFGTHSKRVPSGVGDALATPFREDGTYLITGGLGGLGLLVANWMVEHGARHLVLVGRSQPSAAAKSQLASLKDAGAKVYVAQADVSQKGQLARVLAEITNGDAFSGQKIPLKGIIHAAGVLDDRAIINQTAESMQRVMAPKVQGSFHLHTLTEQERLDFFVLFSSATSLVGTAGQANYAAANAFLDALAHYRQKKGLPALSINWGAWSEVGLAAERLSKMRLEGQGTISPEQGLQIFAELLGADAAQVGIMPITDWSEYRQSFPKEPTMFRLLSDHWEPSLSETPTRSRQPRHGSVARHESRSDERRLIDRITNSSVRQARELLLTEVRQQVSLVLGLGASHSLDPEQGLFDMGLDSLMAIELRSKLQTLLGKSLPATLVFDYPSVQHIYDYLATEILSLTEQEEEAVTTNDASEADTENKNQLPAVTNDPSGVRRKSRRLETLSEDDLEALLMKKVAAIME